jgi:hypothetical protein
LHAPFFLAQARSLPAEEVPMGVDGALTELDAALAKLDELTGKANRFPAEMAAIEKKREALGNQAVDSLAAIEARSAEMAKNSAMAELATLRQKRLKTDISAQEAVVLKIGAQANSLAQQLWSSLEREAFEQARSKLDELFYRAFEHQATLEKYKPLALLQSLKIPDLFTSSVDTKIIRFRHLRERVDKLRELCAVKRAPDPVGGRYPTREELLHPEAVGA